MKHTDDGIDALIAQAFAVREQAVELPASPRAEYRRARAEYRRARPGTDNRTGAAFATSFWQRFAVAAAAIAFCAVLPAALWSASESAGGGTLRDAAARLYSQGILGESPGYFMYLMQQGGAAL